MIHHVHALRHRIGGLAARYGFGTMAAILGLTAIFLGARIYQKMNPAPPGAPAAPAPAAQNTEPRGELSVTVPAGRTLSQDEASVLALPKDDSDAKKNNYALIQRTAKDAAVIDVSGCLMNPVVPKASASATLVFENRDSVSHRVGTDREHFVIVPPGGRAESSALFSFGHGIYGCACDDTTVCGLFFVTP